jgi:PAS domain S-box-containing protein
VLVVEHDLDQLMQKHTLLTDQFPVLHEICTVDGMHVFGTPGLTHQYPVRSRFTLPGQIWEILTVPRDGWFSFFPPEIFFFSTLGLLMLGGSTFSVWRLTLTHGRLIGELEEKSQALNAANLQMQGDLEKIQNAQRQLAVSELRTRTIYEQIPVGVGLLDAESGRFIAVNPEGCRILAASEPELQQLHLQGLLRKAPTKAETDANAEKSQLEISNFGPGEYFVTHGEDRVRCVQLALAPVVRKADEMHRRLAVLQDVTERWQAQQELRQHEERIRVLADTLPGPLLFIDPRERCQFANTAMLQLLQKVNGPSFSSPLGLKTEEFVPPVIHEFLRPSITRALAGEAAEFETNAEMEQLGLGAWMFFHRPLRRQGQVVGFFAFMLDITQQRVTEQQRRDLDSRMADAQRMETVGTLAGGVAHEFNNMLQVVLGFADVLLVHFAQDPFAVENLNYIRHAGRSASELTKQLLAFARFQPGTPVKVNFATVIPAALKLLKHAGGDEIQLRWSCDETLADVLVDPGHLELILANLLLNARHAMDGRGLIHLCARNLQANDAAEPGLPAAGQPSVLLSVCDTGCGMTPEVQARMFDPFFTTRSVGKGAGLGLSTVYGLVVQAGGRIDVRSTPGTGTAMHLLFPSTITPPPQSTPDRRHSRIY